MTSVVNINDVLDGHVGLDLSCIDRLYLNAYVPNLQVGGQVVQFCRHLDQPIASPAVIEKIGNRFRREVDAYAKDHEVAVLHLAKPDRSRWDDRKLDHVRPYMERAEAAGRHGVVAIVAAQEFQWVFGATKKTRGNAVFCGDQDLGDDAEELLGSGGCLRSGGPGAFEHRDGLVVTGDGDVDRRLEQRRFGPKGELDRRDRDAGGGSDGGHGGAGIAAGTKQLTGGRNDPLPGTTGLGLAFG